MRLATRALSALLLLLVTIGCAASGPGYADVHNRIPPTPQDKGRVFVYRNYSWMGNVIRPDVRLDGQVVGESAPGGFFFVDVEPGSHQMECETEARKSMVFSIDPGATTYIHTWIGMGFLVGRVHPEEVSADEGSSALRDCNDTGSTGLLLTTGQPSDSSPE